MNRAQHHAKAEKLLDQAHDAGDQISRSLLLAEAQVHATLALTAAAGSNPPGQGQPETSSTASTTEEPPGSSWRMAAAGIDLLPTVPEGRPDSATPRTPAVAAAPRRYAAGPSGGPVGEPAAPASLGQPPSASYPPRSRRRRH